MTPPATPDELFRLAEEVFRDAVKTFAQYGVRAHPDLRFIPGDAATPYYEPSTMTIGMSVPDPESPKGRMFWLVAGRMWGLNSVAEAIDAYRAQLPLVVSHELVHHLRQHYGAPTENDFVEEQVANAVGLAFVAQHERYKTTLPKLRDYSEAAVRKLVQMFPDAAPNISGFRTGLADMLLARGVISAEEMADVALVAQAGGVSIDDVLRGGRLLDEKSWASAVQDHERAASYFNDRYMQNLFEYVYFHMDWLRAYLAQPQLPRLPDLLEQYLLTDDWEAQRTAEVWRFLLTQVRGPRPLAAAAAEALVAEQNDDLLDLLVAAVDESTAPAIVPALCATTKVDRLRPALQRFLQVPDVAPYAAAMLDRLDILEALDANGYGVAVAAALRKRPVAGAANLLGRLLSNPDAGQRRLAAEAAALHSVDDRPVEALLAALGSDEDDGARARVAAALENVPVAVPALVEALGDDAAPVVAAAAGALRTAGGSAVAMLRQPPPALAARVAALRLRSCAGDPGAEAQLLNQLDDLVRWSGVLARPVTGAGSLVDDTARAERRRLALLGLDLLGDAGDGPALALATAALRTGESRVLDEAGVIATAAVPVAYRPRVAALVTGRAGGPTTADELLAGLHDHPDLERLKPLLAVQPPLPRSEETMLTTVEKLMYLRAVPLFAQVDPVQLHVLADEVDVALHHPGHAVFDFGDTDARLYVVATGRVAVEQDEPDGSTRMVAELGPRHWFGEAGLLTGEPRSARARATEETTVLVIERAAFLQLGSRNPDVLIDALAAVGRRLRAVNADHG